MTAGQRRALEDMLPRCSVADHGPVDPARLFGRVAPVHVEIGFGNGDHLAALAAAHPEIDYLGIEVHRPGVGSLLQRVAAHGLGNIRVACGDAMDALPRLPAASVDRIYLLFPDPWPKLRHHKRRLVQRGFVAEVGRVLRIGGEFRLATDWEPYATQMLEVLNAAPEFRNVATDDGFDRQPESRPETRFEGRGRRLGHVVRNLTYWRVD